MFLPVSFISLIFENSVYFNCKSAKQIYPSPHRIIHSEIILILYDIVENHLFAEVSMCQKDEKTGKWKLDSTAVNVYTALVRLRNQELATHWTRYHVFAAVNIAIVVAFATFSGLRGGRILLVLLGSLLTVLWFLFAYFGKKQLIERWDAALVTFEKEVSEECGFHAFLSKWQTKKGIIHWLQLIVPIIFLMIWVGSAVLWRPEVDRRVVAEESIAKATADLKAEVTLLYQSLGKHEEAIRQLQTTLATQASSGARRKKP